MRQVVDMVEKRGNQRFELPGGKDAVLLLHGLSGSPFEMTPLAKRLHAQGFTVSFPYIEGYGASRRKGDVPKTWDAWNAQVLELFDRLKDHYETVSVAGLCIGAVLALRLAHQRPGQIRSLGLLSTTLFFDGWALPFHKFLLPVADLIPLSSNLSYREHPPFGVKNERMRAFIANQMKRSANSVAGQATIPLVSIREAYRLGKVVRERISEITTPCLIVHALEDETASPKNARFIFDALPTENKKLVLLEDSYHMITLDNENQSVAHEVAAFFLSNLPSKLALADPSLRSHEAGTVDGLLQMDTRKCG
jgi:carboxylesterase